MVVANPYFDFFQLSQLEAGGHEQTPQQPVKELLIVLGPCHVKWHISAGEQFLPYQLTDGGIT